MARHNSIRSVVCQVSSHIFAEIWLPLGYPFTVQYRPFVSHRGQHKQGIRFRAYPKRGGYEGQSVNE